MLQSDEAARAMSIGFMIIFIVFVSIIIGQGAVYAVLPPMGREFGFSDIEISIVVTVSSLCAFLFSPYWGKKAATLGGKSVLLTGGWGTCFSLLLFAAACAYPDNNNSAADYNRWLLYGLILISRGFLFGFFLAAAMVGAFVQVAMMADSGRGRVNGMAIIQGANGTGKILGPVVGGLLAIYGFTVSILFTAVIVMVGMFIGFLLPAQKMADKPKVSDPVKPTDPRIRNYLLGIVAVTFPLAIIQMTLGFLIQDLFQQEPEMAAQLTGKALFTVFLALIIAELGIVRICKVSTLTLIRAGTTIGAVGLITLPLQQELISINVSLALIGLGLGLVQPGITAAPGIVVNESEQGPVAGHVSAAITLGFVVGPVAGTFLYGLSHQVPYMMAGFCLLLLFAASFFSPAFSRNKIEQTATN